MTKHSKCLRNLFSLMAHSMDLTLTLSLGAWCSSGLGGQQCVLDGCRTQTHHDGIAWPLVTRSPVNSCTHESCHEEWHARTVGNCHSPSEKVRLSASFFVIALHIYVKYYSCGVVKRIIKTCREVCIILRTRHQVTLFPLKESDRIVPRLSWPVMLHC